MSKIMELVVAHETLVNLNAPRDILANRAAIKAEVEHLESRLFDYDKRLTEVMPPDFKDWHENNPQEWPEIAAMVITNLRAEVAALRVDAERWRTFIGLPYDIRAEWACNLSLVPVLREWIDNEIAVARSKQ